MLAAAKRHLHPEQQTTVITADARSAKAGLEAAAGGKAVQMLTLDD